MTMQSDANFDGVSVVKKGNVFFDGKCVSHSVLFPDGTRKTVGVILPATLVFNVSKNEVMEIVDGSCQVSVAGGPKQSFGPGGQFSVAAGSSFEISADEPVHYVCSFS